MNAPVRHLLPNDSTRQAQEDTVLSPRFYTTDFEALDRIDVSGVRTEWTELMDELRSDPNKDHFVRDEGWHADIASLPEELRREFLDFLISSVTAEFSGCVLYAEIKKRVANKDRHRFIKLLMTRQPTAAQIVIVHCREVIVDEGKSHKTISSCILGSSSRFLPHYYHYYYYNYH